MALTEAEDAAAQTLRFGDSLALFCDDGPGYVFCQVTSTAHARLAVARQQDKDQKRSHLPNIHAATFDVLSPSKYKAVKKLRTIERRLKGKDEEKYTVEERTQLSQAKNLVKKEEEDNRQEAARLLHKPIVYGQVVQFRQCFSGRYLAVSTKQTSVLEPSNMQLELLRDSDKKCYFKVLPRYKVRSVGDKVRISDQIQLESVKTEGQFLHCSKGNFDLHYVESTCRELNLSATQSAFAVNRHFTSFEKKKPELMLKAGGVVRLYHRELEAYLCAEGSFATNTVVEDVHLRLRPQQQDKPRTLNPSTSSITYWQVELEDNSISGDIILWGQRVRLRHMVTRKYLSLDQDDNGGFKLGLADIESGMHRLSTAFRLYAVIQEEDEIKLESYCRIQHPHTRQWLHALSTPYERRSGLSDGEGGAMALTGLQWDQAKLKQIGVSEEANYDDAFTLQEVTPELVSMFNFVAGMLPVCSKFFRDRQRNRPPLSAKVAKKFQEALGELADFQIQNGEPVKNHQKLLRNLGLIDLCVEILKLYDDKAPHQERSHMKNVCRAIYHCLGEYLEGDSRKNELYVAKFIPFFQSQIEFEISAEKMAMELARDNRKIIDRIPKSQIESFVKLLDKKRDYRFLDYLGVLCVCDGIALPGNQTFITDTLLVEKKDHNIVYLTELGSVLGKTGKEADIIWVSTRKDSWVPLKDFVKTKDDEGYLFLEHQLDLFGKLCQGRNEHAISVITQPPLKYLTWGEAFLCLKDSSLPEHLRAKYCDLIVGMFVNVSPNYSVLEEVTLSYVYEKVSDNPYADASADEFKSITGARMEFFPQLRDWITKFMDQNRDMTASRTGHNELLGEVFRLLHYLVSFGYYANIKDIKVLLNPLLSVLDGQNDKPFEDAPESQHKEYCDKLRFEQNPQNKAVVDAKFRAMQVLDLLFNFRFNVRLERFIYEFKEAERCIHEGIVPPTAREMWKHVAARVREGLVSVHVNLPGHQSTTASRFRQLKRSVGAMSDDFSNDLIEVLMAKNADLLENEEAVQYVHFRLEKVFEETAFFKNRDLVRILLDLAEYKYDKMVIESMHLMNRYYSAHSTLFERAVQAQVLVTPSSKQVYNQVSEKVPILRRLISAKLTPDQERQMAKIIDEFTRFCSLKSPNSDDVVDEPHRMNQRILYNFGVIGDIFDVLDKELDVKLIDTQYRGLREIFCKSFQFLQVMARSNDEVQKRLYMRLDKLLKVPGAIPEMALCIAEIFTGNQDLCLRVKARQVQYIVELLAEHKEYACDLLDALNAIVKVEELDLPLKRNQAFVMTYINQHRAQVGVLLEADMQDARFKLLHDGQEENLKLQYLIKLVDVLATCAEGENRFIESMCQNIFSLEELFKVLNDEQIPLWCKRPYMRFFVWCYLNTAGGKIESGSGDLDHDDRMWELLDNVRLVLRDLSARVRFYSTSSSRANSFRQSMVKRRSASLSGLDSSSKESIGGIISYTFEGVLPMLQVFYRDFFNVQKSEESHRKEIIVSKDIATTLLRLCSQISHMLGNQTQFLTLRNTITTIISYHEIDVPADDVTKFRAESYDLRPDIRSDAAKAYHRDFYEEEEINNRLNQFVVNFQTAYHGPNLISYQLQIQIANDDDYTEVGQDEDLPLGQEFQDFVGCFTSRDGKEANGRHVRKLVDQLDKYMHSEEFRDLSTSERFAYNQLSIKCLQVLRAMIHNWLVRIPPENTPGQAAAEKRIMKVVTSIQNEINRDSSASKLIPLLSHRNDDIARETLALLAALLFGGNRQVQEAFQYYFLNTREERFFHDLKARMERSAIAMRERRALLSQHRAKVERARKMVETLRIRTADKKTGERFKQAVFEAASNQVELQERFEEDEKAQKAEDASTEKLEKFRDDGYIELVLRILGFLCDGQQRVIQNYLREQPDNIKTVNLVSETITYLHLFQNSLDHSNMPLVTQLLQTLVEYTGGNEDNQAVIFDEKVITDMNLLLPFELPKPSSSSDWEDQLKKVLVLKDTIMDLLSSMVELSNPPTQRLAQQIGDTIHLDTLHAVMLEMYEFAVNRQGFPRPRDDLAELALTVGFKILHFCKRLDDFKPRGRKWTRHHVLEEKEKTAWDFFNESTMSIEVLHEDVLQRIYFRVQDEKSLRAEVKEQVKWGVDRGSSADKIRDFVSWSDDIRKDMIYQRQLRAHWVASFFIKGSKLWYYGLLLMTIFLNLFMIGTWDAPLDIFQLLPSVPSYYNPILYLAGTIHLFFALCVAITFFLSNYRNFVLPGFTEYIHAEKLKKLALLQQDDEEPLRTTVEEQHNQLSWFGLPSIYHLLIVIFSVLSLPYKGYFYCFHLLHIVVNNDDLSRVLQSVSRHGRSLLWVTVLGFFIIYIYSVATFAVFRPFFDRDEALFCETLGQCLLTNLRHGLLSTLGDVIGTYNYSFRGPGLRILFDVTFFIIITTIGLNIIFGIIVDTFSELRDEKWKAQNDMTSVCFICGIFSHEFEKRGKGFEHHVKHDHNMWAYLFFFIHLFSKDDNDMTATEHYIMSKLRKKEIDFFPLNQALCLATKEDDNREQLDELKAMVQRLLDRVEKEEAIERRKNVYKEHEQWERRASQAARPSMQLNTDTASSLTSVQLMRFVKQDSPPGSQDFL